jgi:hypothetical protein
MELIAVIIAAIAGFAVGAVWYIALSRHWIVAAGIRLGPDGKPDGSGSAMPFLVSGLAMLVVAGFMRHIFAMSGIDTMGAGLVAGLGVGLFFITPWLAMSYAYAARPAKLTVIDGGYAVIGCAVIGAILGWF